MNNNLFFTKTGALINWLKLPYYSFATLGLQACRLTFRHIIPHFVNEKRAEKIIFQAKKLKIREFHLESKISSTIDYYKFRNYLIQPTVNLPKIKAVTSKKDLKEAVKHSKRMKTSIKEIVKELNSSQLKEIAKKLKIKAKGIPHEELRELIFNTYAAKLPAKDQLQQTAFNGVCGMMVAQFAADRFKGKAWEDIARKARKGANAKTAGLHILYTSLDFNNSYEATSSLHKVLAKRVTAVNSANTNTKNLQKISKMSDGVYRLTFLTDHARHGILLSKEDGISYILDPNIGLLTCQEDKTENLLKRILSIYDKPKTKQSNINILRRFFTFFKKEEPNVDLLAYKFKSSSTIEGIRKVLLEEV